MYQIRYTQDTDKEFWFTVDKSIDELTFEKMATAIPPALDGGLRLRKA